MAVYLNNPDKISVTGSINIKPMGASVLDFKSSQISMIAKRIFDLCLTIPALIILLPLFLLIALWVRCDSPGPAIFRQVRIGKNNKKFIIFKFRTMFNGSEKLGKLCTLETDPRITRCGKILRKYKLDELPQLLNVLKGEMSLVGPRPLLSKHVTLFPSKVKNLILSVPPGITDYASIAYVNENKMLCSASDPERFYIKEILPTKVAYYVFYVVKRNLKMDTKILVLTTIVLFGIFLGKVWRFRNWEVIKDKGSFQGMFSKYRIKLR